MTDNELHLLVQSKCHMVPLYDTIEEFKKSNWNTCRGIFKNLQRIKRIKGTKGEEVIWEYLELK